jgi:hypothetical protein
MNRPPNKPLFLRYVVPFPNSLIYGPDDVGRFGS